MPPLNRVVAVLTPAFSAVAAVGSAWLTKHFPGLPTPSQGQILGVEIAGATAAGGAALSWLKGHQAYEKRLDEGLIVAKKVETGATKADPGLVGYLEQLVEAKVKALTNDNPTPDLSGLTVETAKPAVADNSELASQYADTAPAATPTPTPAAAVAQQATAAATPAQTQPAGA
jgi:hypothetical protein